MHVNLQRPIKSGVANRTRHVFATAKTQVRPTAPAPALAGAQDVASRLATLDQLRVPGAISDAEYQDRRTAILNSI
ncbi:SHOCT domain-containing protein [Streptomyces sp. NPDC057695]|uniref:SHOCT domain-containing protein n=1 Tax=Streptomyces sp. NPDC057695 TaxID=3346217 RepID=UPI00367EB8B0